MELAQHLAKLVGFHYKLKLVNDGKYGQPLMTGQWDGMIGEVIRGVSVKIVNRLNTLSITQVTD